jgi:hypothetical protein
MLIRPTLITNQDFLIVMNNHAKYPFPEDTTGLRLTELTHFYDVAHATGYDIDFISPKTLKISNSFLPDIFIRIMPRTFT